MAMTPAGAIPLLGGVIAEPSPVPYLGRALLGESLALWCGRRRQEPRRLRTSILDSPFCSPGVRPLLMLGVPEDDALVIQVTVVA